MIPIRSRVELEWFSVHAGPDGLGRIAARWFGGPFSRSRVARAGVEADDAVLDQWAELGDSLLGIPPNW